MNTSKLNISWLVGTNTFFCIQQKTLEATSEYVREKSLSEISEDETDRIRTLLRKEAKQWLLVLTSSNCEFVAEYVERIQEK